MIWITTEIWLWFGCQMSYKGELEMNISNLVSYIKSATPELNNSYCFVNGALMRLDEIQNMGYREFWMRSKLNMPKKLYKYYRNTIKDGESINYSHLALENNTVFMQSPSEFDDVYDSDIHIEYGEYEKYRLLEYCRRCQLNVDSKATAQELGNSFLRWIFEAYQRTHSFDALFQKEPETELEKLSNQCFCLRLQNELQKGIDWGNALANILNTEYKDLSLNLKTTFRTSCFTTTPYSQLMWGGSYADCHRGFCIEYTVLPENEAYQEVYQNLFPMIYCRVRPSITEQIVAYKDKALTEENLWDIYFHGALRKSIDWAYQNEWRMLLPMGRAKGTDYNIAFFPITKVFLGNRMTSEKRKSIIEICHRRNIPYVGVTRNPDYFEMKECDVLCEDCPQYQVNS